MCAQKADHVQRRQEVFICGPSRTALEETNSADTPILDFRPPELWEMICCVKQQPREEASFILSFSTAPALIPHSLVQPHLYPHAGQLLRTHRALCGPGRPHCRSQGVAASSWAR